jgi:solute:Na+ symporter, SSS family
MYTTYGGSKAVSYTQLLQMTIITGTLLFTGILLIIKIQEHTTFSNAMHLAGIQGKMNIINFKFDWDDRYNVWSGIIGGFFLQLSYFGTDHSQVSRYLTSKSLQGGRMGLLFNGLIKIPMQFGILFTGVLVYIFFHFSTPPLLFNEQLQQQITSVNGKAEFTALEQKNRELSENKKSIVISGEIDELENVNKLLDANRSAAIELIKSEKKGADTNDSNYIFLWFVTHHLPKGLIGLLIAVIFMASMGSLSSGLNSLASSTVVDIYKRSIHKTASDLTYLNVSRYATLGWGLFCIAAALLAGKLGNLIEVVNIMGSLFYGTILGIFIVAFYVKKVNGNAVFYAALITECFVVVSWYYEVMAFLWLNVLGCLSVVVISWILEQLTGNKKAAEQ